MLSTHYTYLGVSISSKGLGLHIREQSTYEQSQIFTTYTRKPHPQRTIGRAREIPRRVMRNPLSFPMAPG